MSRGILLAILVATTAIGSDTPNYQKGTIKKSFAAEAGSSAQVYCALQGADRHYELKICGPFEDGQSVDFRVKGTNVFIRGEGDKEIKCPEQPVGGLAKPVS